MDDYTPRNNATSNVLAWTTHCANMEASVEEDAGADADEPPDLQPRLSTSNHFKRAPVQRGSEQHESLLTKALQSHSEDEESHDGGSVLLACRRRSITSNFSLASTTEMSCDTGITSPARTSSSSPRSSGIRFVSLTPKADKPLVTAVSPAKPLKAEPVAGVKQQSADPPVQAPEKKRCISFACAAKPNGDGKALMPPPKPAPAAAETTAPKLAKRTCVKFACPAQPSKNPRPEGLEPLASRPVPRKTVNTSKVESPSSARKPHRSPSTARNLRPFNPRRSSHSPVAVRSKKCLTATTKDLQSEGSRFHEFAGDELADDDWIRCDDALAKRKITIDDTLEKENVIRKLGKEAEEEADLEDQLDEEENEDIADGEEGVDDDDDEHEGIVDIEDGWSGYGFDDDASDGYNTDNEVGFAESDDEDDDLVLWTTSTLGVRDRPIATAVRRRASIFDDGSDSSVYSKLNTSAIRYKARAKTSSIAIRPGTPELPDSTDFVCGTLDEDRPLEEAYLSCRAARKQEKHHPIPQDIDPSFPTSEPEDDAEDLYKQAGGDSDEHVWLHGELEDLHHEQDRAGRRKKSDNYSPKRYRSPPPKIRGRSPRRLFDRHSPQRLSSPPLNPGQSPPASPVHTGEGIAFKSLAARPGPTHTKSLPKVPAMFPHPKGRKGRTGMTTKENHVRGAIDIVKGLEQKRQRRKEKFYQKYCNRARKDKTHDKRPPPGQGAERMKEIGLLMAGKIGPGNYVISV